MTSTSSALSQRPCSTWGNKYYWSIVENRRCRADRVVQQAVLYLGEINDSQREQWIRAIEVFDEDAGAMDQLKLFAAERRLLTTAPDRVQVRLKDFELHGLGWFEHSAMGDLLAEDFSIVAKDTLYRCLDSLLEYKAELFEFLHQRWAALFGAKKTLGSA